MLHRVLVGMDGTSSARDAAALASVLAGGDDPKPVHVEAHLSPGRALCHEIERDAREAPCSLLLVPRPRADDAAAGG